MAVVVTAAADPMDAAGTPLAPLGPLRITAGTRPVLIAFLVGALALLTLLAILLLILARSTGRARARGRGDPGGDP